MQSYYFVYWTYIKKTCEWGPVYIDKNFPGVTLPALVNISKCLYEKRLTPHLNRVDPAVQAKCFLGEKLALLERWPYHRKRALAEPTICFLV